MTLAAFYAVAWADYLTDSPEPDLWSTAPEADRRKKGLAKAAKSRDDSPAVVRSCRR